MVPQATACCPTGLRVLGLDLIVWATGLPWRSPYQIKSKIAVPERKKHSLIVHFHIRLIDVELLLWEYPLLLI